MSDAVALYWDFENIHAALIEDRDGPGFYRTNRFRPQDPIVDVGAVVRYAATIGDIVVNRAYGNWQWFWKYRNELLANAVELIQLFPAGGYGKNGADIRLALDALDHALRFKHITHVVVVGGDSDYISLAARCRRLGRTMIGVAVEGSVNHYWMQVCNEFKYYKTLLSKTAVRSVEILGELREEADVGEARRLFVRALSNLTLRTGDQGSVVKAAIKPMMTRLDPAFDEANYGFSTFDELLSSCADLAEVSRGTYDHIYRLTTKGRELLAGKVDIQSDESEPTPVNEYRSQENDDADELEEYVQILKRGKIRLLKPRFRDSALEEVFQVFDAANHGKVESFEEFLGLLSKRLEARGVTHNQRDLSFLKQLLFRLRLFRLHKHNGHDAGIELAEAIDSAEELRKAVVERMVQFVARFADPPVDEDALAILVCGSSFSPEDSALVRSALEVRQDDA